MASCCTKTIYIGTDGVGISVFTDNGDGTLTHDDGLGSITVVDLCALINANCGATAVDNGDGTYSVTGNDGNTVNISSGAAETLTTLVDNGDGTFTYTSEDGTVTNISDVVTTLVDNGDGSFTYTNEAGVVTSYSETVTTLVDNGDGTATYTNEAGVATVLTLGGTGAVSVLTSSVVGNIIGTHDDGNGNVVNIQESVTTFVDNGNGTYTYTNEAGTSTILAAPASSFTDNGDGTLTHNDGNGNTFVIDICAIQAANCPETVTTFVDNGDGTYTYTSEDGTITTTATPGAETVTTLVNNGNGTYTYTSENGAVTTIDINEVDMDINSVTQAGSVLTFTSEDGSSVTADICAIVNGNCPATAVDNGDGTYTITGTDGNAVTVSFTESITTFVDNGDGTATYTSEDGTVTTISLGGGNTSVISPVVTGNTIATHDDGTGTATNIQESVTTFVDNGDGTFTYTSEDGTSTTTTAAPETLTTLVDGTNQFTYTSEDATATVVPQAIVLDNGDNTGTVTDSEGVADTFISELVEGCTGTAIVPATSELITENSLTTSTRGHWTPWTDSGDGCTPAAPSCPELEAYTTDPVTGQQWRWDTTAWVPLGHPTCGTYREITANGATWVPSTTGTPENTWVPITADACATINNPSCVHPLHIWLLEGRHAQLNVADDNISLWVRNAYSFDGGTTWTGSTHAMNARNINQALSQSGWMGQDHSYNMFTGDTNVPPGGSITVCSRLEGRWLQDGGVGVLTPETLIFGPRTYATINGNYIC